MGLGHNWTGSGTQWDLDTMGLVVVVFGAGTLWDLDWDSLGLVVVHIGIAGHSDSQPRRSGTQ